MCEEWDVSRETHTTARGGTIANSVLAVVRHAVEDDLLAPRDVLATTVLVPHPDRIVTRKVVEKTPLGVDVLRVVLSPVQEGACFCEFVPGQYIEVWQPASDHLSRSYSIANAPTGDGRIESHLRRVTGGRLTGTVAREAASA